MSANTLPGHLAALFTTAVWGITYVSTKYLVASFDPAEILLVRLIIAVILLSLAGAPAVTSRPGEEKYFALAGLTGICLYFMLENTALTITSASHVGIIVSAAPLFTALLALPVYHDRQVLSRGFISGFVISMTGIVMLSAGDSDLTVSPIGDLMTVAACISWAVYSLTIKKLSSLGYGSLAITRRAFLWGILFIAPFAAMADISWQDLSRYADPRALLNLAFLGAVASALCFASWNYAVKVLGPVKTCVYIYAGPAITVLFAWLFLGEELNARGIIGGLLTVCGLFLSALSRKPRFLAGKEPGTARGNGEEHKDAASEVTQH